MWELKKQILSLFIFLCHISITQGGISTMEQKGKQYVDQKELFRVTEHALPAPLFTRVTKELKFEVEVDPNNDNAYFTDLARMRKPRHAIEEALHIFLYQDFPDDKDREKVIGAEWWVNTRDIASTHIDKDEFTVPLLCPFIDHLSTGPAPK